MPRTLEASPVLIVHSTQLELHGKTLSQTNTHEKVSDADNLNYNTAHGICFAIVYKGCFNKPSFSFTYFSSVKLNSLPRKQNKAKQKNLPVPRYHSSLLS